MNNPKKHRVIKFVMVMLIIMLPTAYLAYYHYIYDPLFSYKKCLFSTPPGVNTISSDVYRNAIIFDWKKNMALLLTLPNHHKGKPLDDPENSCVKWWSWPKSNFFAKLESNYGHSVGVRLHKNSFVVVDGMTGEELIIHPITKEQGKQWKMGSGLSRPDGSRYDNFLEWSFDFFSLPKEKFLEIQEKVNQHDTTNEEDGPGYRYGEGGEFIPDSRWK